MSSRDLVFPPAPTKTDSWLPRAPRRTPAVNPHREYAELPRLGHSQSREQGVELGERKSLAALPRGRGAPAGTARPAGRASRDYRRLLQLAPVCVSLPRRMAN